MNSNDRYGYTDKSGKLVISYMFIEASDMYDDGYAVVVTTDKKYTVIDKSGKQITSNTFKAIGDHASNFCIKDGCYNRTVVDNVICSVHEDTTSLGTNKYCKENGCYEKAEYSGYCLEHYLDLLM